jgi:hypothetical protein
MEQIPPIQTTRLINQVKRFQTTQINLKLMFNCFISQI